MTTKEERDQVLEEVAAGFDRFFSRTDELDVGYIIDSIRALKADPEPAKDNLQTVARVTLKYPERPNPQWMQKLRENLMKNSKMTHIFTFTRDEVFELLGGHFHVMHAIMRDRAPKEGQPTEKAK